MQNPLQQFLQQSQQQPTGKVYIVARHSGCMVGIEQLTIVHVSPASQAAFLKQYAGRIIIEGSSAEEVLAKLNALPNG
jgi:hypothetical protein